jgi:hypothetical protein
MMEAMPHDEFIVVAVTLWAIWYARRKNIHEDEFQSPLWTHLDEGMTNMPPIFAYLVFGPGRAFLERLLRPIKTAV